MKIGIMGGTFDPIHLGHLIAAEEARQQLKLDSVLFVPTGRPWLKVGRGVSPAHDRWELVARAIAGNPQFELSTIELDRPGPSYTVDTVNQLGEMLGKQARLYFLMGCDSLGQLPRWKNPAGIVAGCWLAVFPREDCAMPDLAALEKSVPGLSKKVVTVRMPVIAISSTDIRRRVARGLSVRYLVPEGVERYIRERGLYLK